MNREKKKYKRHRDRGSSQKKTLTWGLAYVSKVESIIITVGSTVTCRQVLELQLRIISCSIGRKGESRPDSSF